RTDKARQPQRDEALTAADSNLGLLPPIRDGRDVLDERILKSAAPKVKSWGIELVDIQFKRINYKPGVVEKIYARMASERKQIADRFRSEGAGEAAKILGRKERDLQQIESEAYRKEQEIRGKADAEATGIYATAYNANPSAADFYQFIKTLETYQNTLSKDTTAVFTTNSDLFRLLKNVEAEKK
ncbi:MAG TPA: SPFH domain-containing protein, partial [Haloferula sp.]